MSNNPKLQDMGEHAKQLLGLIEECKPDANLELLAEYVKRWNVELSKIQTDDIVTKHGYIIHSDNTVTDPKTGLMWKREIEKDCGGSDYKGNLLNRCTWENAIKKYKTGGNIFSGYDDWRLPTIEELASLVLKIKNNDYCLCLQCFSDENAIYDYWSSTPVGNSIYYGKSFWFYGDEGHFKDNSNSSTTNAVRLVRSTK